MHIRNSLSALWRTFVLTRAIPSPRAEPRGPGSFLFAEETVSNTIPREADMTWGTAMISDICRQPGDGLVLGT